MHYITPETAALTGLLPRVWLRLGLITLETALAIEGTSQAAEPRQTSTLESTEALL